MLFVIGGGTNERPPGRAQLDRYIRSKLYWVLHAPRQTGKTTFLISGMKAIRQYADVFLGKDPARPIPSTSPAKILPMMLNNILKSWSALVGQHVDETVQAFEQEAIDAVWDATRGQSWLVNAILQKCTWTLCPGGETVTIDHIREARELLIQEWAVHLDSLAERLRDSRIKRMGELIVTGDMDPDLLWGDDFVLAQDLRLVTADGGSAEIANPIYREIIALILSYPYQLSIPQAEWRWQKPDSTLDMDALFRDFQDLWSQHGDIWEEKADYTEAFPHLLVMAFLQRVTNGGRIEREFAAGRGRVDVAVFYGGVWTVIEIKLVSRRGLNHGRNVLPGRFLMRPAARSRWWENNTDIMNPFRRRQPVFKTALSFTC